MSYASRIVLDSVAPNGHRLTTFELTYWRAVHDELMTHRDLSRCTASARAIPVERMIAGVLEDPALPVNWGTNRPGMQPGAEVPPETAAAARALILGHRDQAVELVRALSALGLHKQIANRYLQPFAFTTVIVSATSYTNWFGLRCHPAAQAEIRHVALMMQEQYAQSVPQEIPEGGWHLPYVRPGELEEYGLDAMIRVSTGRVARVSYLNHNGMRDINADIELHDRLISGLDKGEPGHMSPLEHVAQAMGTAPYDQREIDHATGEPCEAAECPYCNGEPLTMCEEEAEHVQTIGTGLHRHGLTGVDLLNDVLLSSGNFRGWRQYRKSFRGEYIGGVRR
jgi:hypothetical protein